MSVPNSPVERRWNLHLPHTCTHPLIYIYLDLCTHPCWKSYSLLHWIVFYCISHCLNGLPLAIIPSTYPNPPQTPIHASICVHRMRDDMEIRIQKKKKIFFWCCFFDNLVQSNMTITAIWVIPVCSATWFLAIIFSHISPVCGPPEFALHLWLCE